ncbi:MAG: PAS domain S-box protein [Microgenomates group bacterium]
MGLVYNASLLLTMVLIFELLTTRQKKSNSYIWQVMVGIILGGVGLAVMSTKWELIPGLIFDTRTVLLGISGLFFGWIPTLIAIIVTVLYRISIGGVGTLAGVSEIIMAGAFGLIWRYLRGKKLHQLLWIEMYLFGLVIHIVDLALVVLLPKEIMGEAFLTIWFPVITVNPLATLMLGVMMSNRLKRDLVVEELAESEEKYRVLIEQAADGIFVVDTRGHFLLVNSKMKEMLGYTDEEIKKVNIIDTYLSEEREAAKKRLDQLALGTDLNFKRKMLRKNGQVLIIEAKARRLSDGRLQAFVRDITERERTEKKLIESEEKFSQVFKNGPQIITISSLKEGIYLDVNNAFTESLGYKKEEVIGKSVLSLNIWAENTERDKMIEELKKNKIIRDKEYRFRKKNGEIITCLCSITTLMIGEKEYLLVLGINIEGRKRAEIELARANMNILTEKHKLEAILHDMGDAVFVTDDKKKIILANKAMEILFGLGEREMMGKNIEEVLSLSYETTGKKPVDLIETVFEKKQQAKPVDTLVVRNKSGTSVSVDGVASPIVDENLKLVGTVWVLRDVTKEKALEQMRVDFISLASHQLRTPLTGIKWFVELLDQNAPKMSIEKIQKYIEKIGESNNRMIDLVNDLMATSKADSGKIVKEVSSYPVKDLLQRSIDEQGRLFLNKKITIEGMELISEDLEIDADVTQMVQVFGNLFDNAVRYSPEGSKIEVGAELGLGKVKIYVRDHGLGVPLKQQSKVFDKFFRADNVAKTIPGSGLGLYLAKSMVESHGGKIWFESKEKLGTTFFVELPIKQKNGRKEESDDRGG